MENRFICKLWFDGFLFFPALWCVNHSPTYLIMRLWARASPVLCEPPALNGLLPLITNKSPLHGHDSSGRPPSCRDERSGFPLMHLRQDQGCFFFKSANTSWLCHWNALERLQMAPLEEGEGERADGDSRSGSFFKELLFGPEPRCGLLPVSPSRLLFRHSAD